MKWIVITSPDFFAGEGSFLRLLLQCGVDLIHLRKPNADETACAHLLEKLSAEERRQVVVHQHFQQAEDFGLHGIHLNHRNPEPLAGYAGSISRSCHSLEEVEMWKEKCDYVFLSPIFNSISKQGYYAAYSSNSLENAAEQGIVDRKVYALGGVTKAHLPLLRRWHFGGAVMLGSVNQLATLPRTEAERELRGMEAAVHKA